MAKIEWKGGTLLAPVPPALITCGTAEAPNVFTAAWTGILCSDPPKTYVSVRPSRFSHELISKTGEFAVNLPTEAMAAAADFCGVRSGRDINKFEVCGLETAPGAKINVPVLAASPISLECRVFEVVHLGSHDMFMADIVAVDVNDDCIDAEGKLHLDRCAPIAYSHGEYFALGKKLGSFGFSVKKKKTHCKKDRKK